MFLPQMLGTVAAGFAFGWLSDRLGARVLLPIAAGTLAAALVLATVVDPGPVALLYGLVFGMGMGQIRAISSATYPRWFGTANIAAIMGIATSVMIGASATGPLLLSVGNDTFGSYTPVLLTGAAVTIAVGAATAFVKPPRLAP